MNKKVNTLLFILGGTVVNLILALVMIGVLLFLVGRLSPIMGDQTSSLIPFAFLGGIMIAMLIYQKLAKWVIKHYGLEDKLDPLFNPSNKRQR